MIDSGWADHSMGLELQIEELVTRREHARAARALEVVHQLDTDITALQLELAETFDHVSNPSRTPRIRTATADQLAHPAA
jgi:hypothetical protein